jgi:alpha-beta hydrolase superfamily lysophospholipase
MGNTIGPVSTMTVRTTAFRWCVRITQMVILITVTLIVGAGVQAVVFTPDLHEWHRLVPVGELRADEMGESFTLAEYLAREEQMFREVHDRVEIPVSTAPGAGTVADRYDAASVSSPRRAARDWNRTFEMSPAEIRGGALLVHGLTDSPYSMRRTAELLRDRGFYVLGLRMPGHGTVPGGLTQATSEDWMAAVRLGARHVARTAGQDRPLLLVGYSNGGALVLRYAVEAAGDSRLPAPTRVIVLSAMIGVSPLARLARVISALGPIPFFEKARWLDVIPEYNPFKFNSFPANAGQQSYRVSAGLQAELVDAAENGVLDRLPPILAFQSVVDATVSTPAVVTGLFDRLTARQHELVVFDVNRQAGLEPFIRPEDAALVATLAAGGPRLYRRTLITNVDPGTLEVKARMVAPGATGIEDVPLGLAWPAQMFSLSHVALPFPEDDPVYGSAPPAAERPVIALGRLSPRGEKGVLTVPIDTLMRIGWNPFFPYVASRIDSWADAAIEDANRRGSQP